MSADSDICWQYRIGFWGARYDVYPIISVDFGADIGDVGDTVVTADIWRYWYYKPLVDIEISNHA